MRCLRVKTKAVGLQVVFRLFLLIRGMDGIILLNKNPRKPTAKSGIETNCNFDFIKTNSEMNKCDAFETLACSLGTVEPTEREDSPPLAVLSNN